MKVKDLLKVILGIFLGAVTAALWPGPTVVEPECCDTMEYARIKIALEECSDAAMACTWGEDYKETALEEE